MMNIPTLIFSVFGLLLANLSYAGDPKDVALATVTDMETIFCVSQQLAAEAENNLASINLTQRDTNNYSNHVNKLKFKNLSQISRALNDLSLLLTNYTYQSEKAINLQNKIIRLSTAIKRRPLRLFQKKTTEYFSQLYADKVQNIEFVEKLIGRQLGSKIFISLNDGKKLTYYAKTHGQGMSRSASGSSAEPVDPKELFVYKFLEFSKLGNETHFFYDDNSNFYIATRDAGFNKDLQKEQEFKTYDRIDFELKHKKNTLNEEDEPLVNIVIYKGLVLSDIISRIFILSDLVNNTGNIGFTLNNDEFENFKLLDFDVKTSFQYKEERVYQGFLSGNGVHLYAKSSDAVIRYFLAQRNIKKRIETAKEIMQGQTELFFDSIDKAYAYVEHYLNEHNLELPDTAGTDLKNYVDGIKENLAIFMTGLSEDDR